MIHAPRTGRAATSLLFLAAALLAAALLTAGCGAPAPALTAAPPTTIGPAAATPSTSAPTLSDAPSTTPTPTATPEPASAVPLPWPATNAAGAKKLQSEVDAGAQPWLLDPSEVAASYAAAAHGWVRAEAEPGATATLVLVRDGDQRLAVSVAQPARTGLGGIWVVTGETRAA